MRIRRATEKDIDKLASVEMSSGYHKNLLESDIRKLFVSFFRLSHPYAYILEEKNKSIGYVSIRIAGSNGEIGYLALIRKYQGRGLGKLLLNKALFLCKQMKCNKIYLSVRQDNIRAINLYKKYGFETVGINKRNKLLMERILK